MNLLLTAFGPFPGAPRNPTGPLVKALKRHGLPGVRLKTALFETRYADVDTRLPRLIEKHRPDAVVLFGLAGAKPVIRIEARARNASARLRPDAAGNIRSERHIDRKRETARFTALPVRAIAAQSQAPRLKGVVSRDAGDYLCNYAYFRALEAVERGATQAALFIHVPLPRTGETPLARLRKQRPLARHLTEACLRSLRAVVSSLRQTG